MTHDEFCSMVNRVSGLHIHEAMFHSFYPNSQYIPDGGCLPKILIGLASGGYGFDSALQFFNRAYKVEEPLGMKSQWVVEDAWMKERLKKEPDWICQISAELNYMIGRKAQSDAVFSLLANGSSHIDKKLLLSGFGIGGYSKDQRRFNICRTDNGELRSADLLLLLPQNQTTTRIICDSAIAADDLDAVNHLLAIPKIAKHLPMEFLVSQIKNVNNELLSQQRISKELSLVETFSSSNLQDYARLITDSPYLAGTDYNSEGDGLKVIFKKTMLSQAPEEFVHLAMTMSNFSKDRVNAFLLRMHLEGLDTIKGFLMAHFGRFFMIQTPNHSISDAEVLQICASNKHRRGYLAILCTLPPKVIATHAKSDLLLDEAYKLTGDLAFVREMSITSQAKAFSGDLGL